MAYRITRGDFQARFDALGRLTHIGHPDRIREQPTCFYTVGPIREGHWTVNCGSGDIFFDPEVARRVYDFDAGTLMLESEFRGPIAWYGLDLRRTYRIVDGLLKCEFELSNWDPRGAPNSPGVAALDTSEGFVTAAAPIRRLRYCTGVNSWTDFSSDWAHRPYPTNLRCEQEFFWGAAVSPAHDVIGYFSESKVDSWSAWYQGPGEQRVRSFCIEPINSLDPHPSRWQHQDVRLGGRNPTYRGAFYIGRFESIGAFFRKAADTLGVAFLAPKRCAGFSGETLSVDVVAPERATVTVRVSDESGGAGTPIEARDGRLELPLDGPAGWRVLKLNAGGKETEARLWQHDGWEQTLRTAARFADVAKPASAYNGESVLALITLAQAAELLGDDASRHAARRTVEQAYQRHYDPQTGRHGKQHNRLQNYGSFLDAMRVYITRTGGDDELIARVHRSARQLMSLQKSDGNFYNHHNIYNNVIHPVKSLYDWGAFMKSRGHDAEAGEVFASVERAYHNIARAGDDTGTEGSDHFEDGMLSCAGYQIAALWPHFGRQPEDLQTAVDIYRKRRALKSRVPDSRFFGATLRSWELYWAMGLGQAMGGGHGWNAWSASLAHALFMATGEWDYLLDAYATVTNCLQSVDTRTGQFHVTFVIDPCWSDYFGLGTQRPGEVYVPVPDEINIACESHSVFLTLDDSFYRQTYLRLRPGGGVEVLNGRLVSSSDREIALESFALRPEEVVVAREDASAAVPNVIVNGERSRVVIAGTSGV